MKSVMLFRHGEASMQFINTKDHDRPLTDNGINEARSMGTYITLINKVPKLIISSTALRTKQTIKEVISYAKWDSTLIFEKSIYGGKAALLLGLLKQQDDKYNSLCLVGHEPNFSLFIMSAINKNIANFPTASIGKVDFEVNSWEEIEFGFGILDFIKNPKNIL